jgi:hypothetical protein
MLVWSEPISFLKFRHNFFKVSGSLIIILYTSEGGTAAHKQWNTECLKFIITFPNKNWGVKIQIFRKNCRNLSCICFYFCLVADGLKYNFTLLLTLGSISFIKFRMTSLRFEYSVCEKPSFFLNTEYLARLILLILFKQPIRRRIWKLNWLLGQESGYMFKHFRRANQTPITVDIMRNVVTYGCHDTSGRDRGRQDCDWYIWTYTI